MLRMREDTSPPQPRGAENTLTLVHAENCLQAHTETNLLRQAQIPRDERRLQAAMESTGNMITTVNCAGVILSQSRAVSSMFGYAPEELVGKTIFGLIHEEDLDRLRTAFFEIIDGCQEDATVPFYHPLRDGSFRQIEATMCKVHGTSSPCVVFIFRPVANFLAVRTEPARPDAFALPSSEDRHCILLSHGRRIPL